MMLAPSPIVLSEQDKASGSETVAVYVCEQLGGLSSAISSLLSGDTLGVAAVAFLGDQPYALLGGGGCSHGNATPSAVIRINRKQGTAEIVANLSGFFREHPVAHPEPDDFAPDGTGYAMRPFRGDLMVVEPNHGRLLRINPSEMHGSGYG